jgi:hypothetical protein
MKNLNKSGNTLPIVLITIVFLVATLIAVIDYGQRGLVFVAKLGFTGKSKSAADSGLAAYLDRLNNVPIPTDCLTTSTSLVTVINPTTAYQSDTIKTTYEIKARRITTSPIQCEFQSIGRSYRNLTTTEAYTTEVVSGVIAKRGFNGYGIQSGSGGLNITNFKHENGARITGSNIYSRGTVKLFNSNLGPVSPVGPSVNVAGYEDISGVSGHSGLGTPPTNTVSECSIVLGYSSSGSSATNGNSIITRGNACYHTTSGENYSINPTTYSSQVPLLNIPRINEKVVTQSMVDRGVAGCNSIELAADATYRAFSPGKYGGTDIPPSPTSSCSTLSLTANQKYTLTGNVHILGNMVMNSNVINNGSAQPVVVLVEGTIVITGETRFEGTQPILFVSKYDEGATNAIDINYYTFSGGGSKANGHFIAPYGTILFRPFWINASGVGSLAANSISISGHNSSSYDRSILFNVVPSTSTLPFAWGIKYLYK